MGVKPPPCPSPAVLSISRVPLQTQLSALLCLALLRSLHQWALLPSSFWSGLSVGGTGETERQEKSEIRAFIPLGSFLPSHWDLALPFYKGHSFCLVAVSYSHGSSLLAPVNAPATCPCEPRDSNTPSHCIPTASPPSFVSFPYPAHTIISCSFTKLFSPPHLSGPSVPCRDPE